jgi:hypothetical protein
MDFEGRFNPPAATAETASAKGGFGDVPRAGQEAAPPLAWSEVAARAGKNLGPSAKKFAGDIVSAIVHPVQTLNSIDTLGKGLADKFATSIGIPRSAAGDREEEYAQAGAAADAVGQFFKDRYGGVENVKRTMAEDPVGFASDLAAVLTGGELLATKVPVVGSEVSRVLGTASRVVNPITTVEKAAQTVGKGVRAAADRGKSGTALKVAEDAAATGPAAGTRLSPTEIVQAFDKSAIDPTLPTVSRNRGVGGVAQMLNNTLAGTPISRSFARQGDQAAARAEQIASTTGSDVGQAALAGERAQAAAKAYESIDSRVQQTKLYDRATSLIDPEVRSPLFATRRAVGNVQGMIQNPDVRALVTDKNFASLAKTIESAGTAGLTFDDLRQLRTQVRLLRPAEGSAVGINKVAINKLYDGLTQDMYRLAQQAGGDTAVHALRRADQYTRALETVRLPSLESLIGAPSGENAFAGIMRLAQTGAGADWRRLAQVKRSIGSNAWDDVSATTIRRMGNPAPGSMTSVDLDQFSPATFMTNFNKLSPRGKELLFGGRSGELGAALDDLSTAVGEMKRVASLGNPSGTGRQASAFGTLLGLFSAPVSTTAALTAGHALSWAMTNPKIVRWLVSQARATTRDAPLIERYNLSRLHERLPIMADRNQEVIDLMRGLFPLQARQQAQTGQPAL